MTPDRAEVFGGVDTHKEVHVAAAVDVAGRLLGTAAFAADADDERVIALPVDRLWGDTKA